jgi:hypothetical protein
MRNKLTLSLLACALSGGLLAAGSAAEAAPRATSPQELDPAAYPVVQIHDSTPFNATGDVEYASIFCSDDHYSETPKTTWSASSRGACLVTRITAVVITPRGNITADPYTSSGTSYSQFAIIQTGDSSFAVTRVVT